jgi:hypothetical protein
MHPGREVDCSETIRTGVRLPNMNWRAGDLLIKQKQKKHKIVNPEFISCTTSLHIFTSLSKDVLKGLLGPNVGVMRI